VVAWLVSAKEDGDNISIKYGGERTITETVIHEVDLSVKTENLLQCSEKKRDAPFIQFIKN
jgi:hypothetical protein